MSDVDAVFGPMLFVEAEGPSGGKAGGVELIAIVLLVAGC
jgi:hypothetical protein